MQCYTELITPSVVTHAVVLDFRKADSRDLVIAKTSLLQIFSLERSVDGHEDELKHSRLVLVGEYPLSGTVTGLAAVRSINTKSGGDALLISFKDAKLSLLQWNPESYRISTISIHMYDGEKAVEQPFGPSLGDCEAILSVDPSSRCAALKFGTRQLAILPFNQSGDDFVGDEEDVDGVPLPIKKSRTNAGEEGFVESLHTPYKASFVMPLTTLDPALTIPLDLAFLHEYRTPTLGIVSTSVAPSNALLAERKDVLMYTVFSLDLEQRASTNLVTLQKLPSDLFNVVPLPPPIGGALLVGTNELIHVDQSGKPNAVAVNEFATQTSDFSMSDQSHLDMRLEHCRVEPLKETSGDVLIVLNNGEMAILTFKKLGRNVSGLSVNRVPVARGGNLLSSAPSSLAVLGDKSFFVGCYGGDSILIKQSSSAPTLSRKRSHADMLGNGNADGDDELDDIDEDDLYATTTSNDRGETPAVDSVPAIASSGITFTLVDTLPSFGPIRSVCFGRAQSNSTKLELAACVGAQGMSRLVFANRSIPYRILRRTTFENAKKAWIARIQNGLPGENTHLKQFQTLLFVYDGQGTKIYNIPNANDTQLRQDNDLNGNSEILAPSYDQVDATDFEYEGDTMNIATLNEGKRLIQCKYNEVRTYDSADMTLSQIIPMVDEATDDELNILHSSCCDPYLLLIREDLSAQIFSGRPGLDLESLEGDDSFHKTKWQSGCIYSGKLNAGNPAAFMLDEQAGLHIFSLPDLRPIYSASMLPYLPVVLNTDSPQRRPGARERLIEVVVADIGRMGFEQPYLIVRSFFGDLTMYEPFHTSFDTGVESWTTQLCWKKSPSTYIPSEDEDAEESTSTRPSPLQVIRMGEHCVVHNPTSSSALVIKEPYGLPKIIQLSSTLSVRALVPLNHERCENGFGLLTSDIGFYECQFFKDVEFSTGWSVRKTALGTPIQEVRHVAYHSGRDLYIVATCRNVNFHFSEDDVKHQEIDDLRLRPQIPQYTLHLVSSRTHDVIHSLEMPYQETITSLKIMSLEVSEHTHEYRSLVVVGTATLHGEDMPAKGSVMVFEILDVVPDPELPESGVQLHAISREETRGCITALEPFGHGLIGTAQGQKIMIRGLKEDGSCLPVAFLDAQCYTSQLKALGQSGLWLAGDVWKGVWIGGFVEEPYKLNVLSRSSMRTEVVAADFLPFDGQLFIIAIDTAMDLHIFQYDPENPKSVGGTRLLTRSKFHVGHLPTSMTLLPATITPSLKFSGTDDQAGVDADSQQNAYQILITSTSGSIALVSPIDEASHRRLSTLQTQLTSVLEHAAGLNPRAYRAVEGEGMGSRGVLDGGLVQRVYELGSARRAEMLARAGSDLWTFRADLDALNGRGLGFV